MDIAEIAVVARSAAIRLAVAETDVKNNALAEIGKALNRHSGEIVAANERDAAISSILHSTGCLTAFTL
jgi:gamma-glutamyl phosphate reductase